MKKEYLILIVVIIFAGSYLLLHKENRDNYKLPEIEDINTSKLTGIIIKSSNGNIKFIKKGENWILTDKEFPADSSSVQDMFDTLKTFKLTALVSQKKDLQRYELDEKKHVHVKLLENSKTIFEFTIGKPAPSFNHTFVMLANDKNIYHANGSFRGDFNQSLDDFRDKKILEFHEESIKQFSIEKDGKSKTLISKEEKSEEKENNITWSSEDGTSVDKEAVSDLLSNISFLECEKYPNTPDKNSLKNKKSLCRIQLENKNTIELTLYKNDKQDNIIGISSMNDYLFSLSESDGSRIVENIEKLLGIEKKEEKEN
ncbi:MAG: DUF4340 domain-containing protein [Deltaproteobacteria bacterium]|jgi:hypothetical protein|nr:DUF4340 domain-containing protein [Deltaproteobacteria bacterium]